LKSQRYIEQNSSHGTFFLDTPRALCRVFCGIVCQHLQHPYPHVLKVLRVLRVLTLQRVSSCGLSSRGRVVCELTHSAFWYQGSRRCWCRALRQLSFLLPGTSDWLYHPSKERPFLERVSKIWIGRDILAYGSNYRRRTVTVAKRVVGESLACSCEIRKLALRDSRISAKTSSGVHQFSIYAIENVEGATICTLPGCCSPAVLPCA
jgi:hypothetical protein